MNRLLPGRTRRFGFGLIAASLLLFTAACPSSFIPCEHASDCPDGWWCADAGGDSSICVEGEPDGPDDDDTVPDDDDTVPDDDDSAHDDDDSVVDDDDSISDDDDSVVDDDDSAIDDDDIGPDDDDSATSIPPPDIGPGGLCASPGRSVSPSFTATHCTGPVTGAADTLTSPSFTVVVGAARLLQLSE